MYKYTHIIYATRRHTHALTHTHTHTHTYKQRHQALTAQHHSTYGDNIYSHTHMRAFIYRYISTYTYIFACIYVCIHTNTL